MTVVPLNSRRPIVNFSEPDGARELAQRVQAYWNVRGHRQVRASAYVDADGFWSVKSNLVGGLPA